METLSIDVTHRRFYVEVSQYHPPLRTNGSLYLFESLLRSRGFRNQALAPPPLIRKQLSSSPLLVPLKTASTLPPSAARVPSLRRPEIRLAGLLQPPPPLPGPPLPRMVSSVPSPEGGFFGAARAASESPRPGALVLGPYPSRLG